MHTVHAIHTEVRTKFVYTNIILKIPSQFKRRLNLEAPMVTYSPWTVGGTQQKPAGAMSLYHSFIITYSSGPQCNQMGEKTIIKHGKNNLTTLDWKDQVPRHLHEA